MTKLNITWDKVLLKKLGNFFSFLFIGLILILVCATIIILIEAIFYNPISLAIICFTIFLLMKWGKL